MKNRITKWFKMIAGVVCMVTSAFADAKIAYVADSVTGEYCGAGYKISVSVSAPATGATVQLSETGEDGTWVDEVSFAGYKNVCTDKPMYFKITAAGYADATGSAKVTVTPKTLTEDYVWGTYSPEGYTYDGTEKKPGATTGEDPESIITVDDYTVSYENNINAGEDTAKIIFTGMNNFTGSCEETFSIAKADNSWTTAPSIANWTYGQTPSEPVYEAKVDNDKVTVTYSSGAKPTQPGDYTATFTVPASQNYNELKTTVNFKVNAAKIHYVVDPVSGEYCGAGYKISVSVSTPATGATVQLSETGEDGTWVDEAVFAGYKNVCTDKPMYFKITATGYADATGSAKVTVTPKTLTEDYVWGTYPPEGYTYDGTEKKPGSTTGEDPESIITADDYTVSYENNVNAGEDTAKIIFTGKNNFTGSCEETFSIAKADNSWTIAPSIANWTYGQTPSEPVYEAKVDNDKVTVTYSSGAKPTQPGDYTATFTVPASQNYNELTADVGFKINSAGTVTVTIAGRKKTVAYTGSEQSVSGYDVVSISDANYKASDFKFTGSALAKGVDVGVYPMGLKGSDFVNLNAQYAVVEFDVTDGVLTVSRAENEWTVSPAIEVWTYGEAAKMPVGAAKFGTASFAYSPTPVGAAGNYTMTASVPATDNYTGLGKTVHFTIAKATVSPDDDPGKTDPSVDPSDPDQVEDPTIKFSPWDYVGMYDGAVHTIDTNAMRAAYAAIMGERVSVQYAAGSGAPNLPWEDAAPVRKNVGTTSFWYKVSSPNYADVIHPCKVIITNRPVTVTSGTKIDFVYDGLPHDYPHVTVGGMGFVEGEGIVTSNWATVTSLKDGVVYNTFDMMPIVGTDFENYAISVVTGVLAVINEPPPPGKFVVVFDANGGKVNEFYRFITNGHPVGELPEVTRNGFDWKGWFTEISGGDVVSSDTLVTTNTVYHAQWTEQKIPVSRIDKPVAAEGDFVYDGQNHVGVASVDARLSVVGTLSATNAGDYSVGFVLPSQTAEMLYAWADGTTDPIALSWSIKPRSLTDDAVTVGTITDQPYAVKPIEPVVDISYDGAALKTPDDYTIAYSNNVSVGTGCVLLTGVGNFTGERCVAFRIVPILATVGEYMSFDLESDLGVVIDADWRAGDTVTVKAEGLAKGLKVAKDGTAGRWFICGVPSETVNYETQPAFIRVKIVYKDKTKGRAETLQLLPLAVRASGVRTLTSGILGEAYLPMDMATFWPEAADAAEHPKQWSFRGWPAGIRYNASSKDVAWSSKVDGIPCKTNVAPYHVYGVPTSAGMFSLTATYKRLLADGKTAQESEKASIIIWPRADEQAYRYTNQVGVAVQEMILNDVKSVSGLPRGIRFAKGVISGTPTKSGIYAVTATLADKTKDVFLWQILRGENTGVLSGIDWTAVPGTTHETSFVTMMQGAVKGWNVPVADGAKVSVSGLPSGLALKQDKITKEWCVTGTPTRVGNFVAVFNTVRNGEIVTERIAMIVEPNNWTGTWYGVQDAAYDKATISAVVSVAAGGTVKLTLTENAKKTTVTTRNLDVAGTSATFALLRNCCDPFSVDRVAVVDFQAQQLLIDGVVVADLRQPMLLDCSDGMVMTFVFETSSKEGRLSPYAYVSATYNEKNGRIGVSGKLSDGTPIAGTTYAVAMNEETTVFAPVLVMSKNNHVISLTLGDISRVFENGSAVRGFWERTPQ